MSAAVETTDETFIPQSGYALGPERRNSTVWIPFARMTVEHAEAAEPHIMRAQHRMAFRAFWEGWSGHMLDGETIGETLRRCGSGGAA